MNKNFSRIITLLRKEKNISQKQAASDLNISQALLSHYEKGIRECGLDFIVRIADYYNVSCVYLLGRTPDRNGAKISVDDIPENDTSIKDNAFKGSVFSTLNKKLIINSINIIFDILQKINNKPLTTETSNYFMITTYKIFRILYASNSKNAQDIFSLPPQSGLPLSNAVQCITENNISCILSGVSARNMGKMEKISPLSISSEKISIDYPAISSSLFNLIQRAEITIDSSIK